MSRTMMHRAIALLAVPLMLAGCTAKAPSIAAAGPPATTYAGDPGQVVGLRRLTESQYRNSIADIFGADIKVAGRFEPIVRPVHELIASGSSESTISPAGLEQFDAIARNIAAQVFDGDHRAYFVKCTPADPERADAACAARVLTPIGRYLFRRPLTRREQAGYVRMAGDAAAATGSFHAGLELALSAMLVSPNFLYIVESATPDTAHPGDLQLDDYARAARLSFLLWNTTPNETLLAAAEAGRLGDPAQLSAIATGMVRSPRLEQGVRAFFADMLLFEKFDEMAKDNVVYPRFNADVAAALPEQMLRTIVDHLVTRDGDYRELFTTRRTFVNRALGPLYQVPVATSTGWQPLDLAAGDDRAGILGQAGFLALYSHSGRSSPTLRGRAVRELLLCQPVPNPPGNVNFTAVQDVHNAVMRTARMRLNAHNTDPVCAACHRITDPLGLPLEQFDGIGAFRATENKTPIDTRGVFEGVEFTGASGLGKAMAASGSTTECVAGRALEYATGRPNGEDGAGLIARIETAFAGKGYRIPALFLQIATLPDAYRISRGPAPAPATLSMIETPFRSVPQ